MVESDGWVIPKPTPETNHFWEGANKGKLICPVTDGGGALVLTAAYKVNEYPIAMTNTL
ncbi:MAG: hypothetical protein ACR2PG_15260 [Hyphomicrobiaceae bacterium]